MTFGLNIRLDSFKHCTILPLGHFERFENQQTVVLEMKTIGMYWLFPHTYKEQVYATKIRFFLILSTTEEAKHTSERVDHL